MDADLSESEVSGYICFVNDLNSFENALERYYDIIFQVSLLVAHDRSCKNFHPLLNKNSKRVGGRA